jgi:hypothetical protein
MLRRAFSADECGLDRFEFCVAFDQGFAPDLISLSPALSALMNAD